MPAGQSNGTSHHRHKRMRSSPTVAANDHDSGEENESDEDGENDADQDQEQDLEHDQGHLEPGRLGRRKRPISVS